MKRSLLTAALAAVLSLIGNISSFAQNPHSGTWTGAIELGQSSLTLVFHISEGPGGDLLCTMDSPDQGAKGIPAKASVDDMAFLNIDIASIGAKYKGMLFKESIMGTFSQSGRDFPMTLKKGEQKLNRPQTPVGPFPYTEEEVTFENVKAGATLAGTLITPQGATKDTPVVIMITGSGLEDRNEEVFDHKPFLVIADYLARNGIATLRYDDRTFGQSNGGDVANATTLDFLEDAEAGVRFLRERGSFGKIGALGHSEGSSIAFMLGRKKEVDFVVSLAGIGVKGDIALTAQANRVLELSGIDQTLTVQQYRTNVSLQNSPWTTWFINYDPSDDIRGCTVPVFAVNGDKDIQVISSVNLPFIEKTLSSNPANFIKEYPSLNHLFQHCSTGDTTEYRSIEETFSEEVMKDLSEWIRKTPLK